MNHYTMSAKLVNASLELERAMHRFQTQLAIELVTLTIKDEPIVDWHFWAMLSQSGKWKAAPESKLAWSLHRSYSDDKVEGQTVQATITEWLRRQGWAEVNEAKPMTLISGPTVKED